MLWALRFTKSWAALTRSSMSRRPWVSCATWAEKVSSRRRAYDRWTRSSIRPTSSTATLGGADARISGRQPPAGLDPGVVYERHYALNWLIRYSDQEWDDISTDT